MYSKHTVEYNKNHYIKFNDINNKTDIILGGKIVIHLHNIFFI